MVPIRGQGSRRLHNTDKVLIWLALVDALNASGSDLGSLYQVCTLQMRSTKTAACATSRDFVSSPGNSTEIADSNSTVVCEGWVLKKRRKKMQGEFFISLFGVTHR